MKPLGDGETYKERHSLQAFRLKITPEQQRGEHLLSAELSPSISIHHSLCVAGSWEEERGRGAMFSLPTGMRMMTRHGEHATYW